MHFIILLKRSIFNAHSLTLNDSWRELDKHIRSNPVESLQTTLSEAWKATTIMDGFDIEARFKSDYDKNKNILKSICKQIGISTKPQRNPATITTQYDINDAIDDILLGDRTTYYSHPSQSREAKPTSSTRSDLGWIFLVVFAIGGLIADMAIWGRLGLCTIIGASVGMGIKVIIQEEDN